MFVNNNSDTSIWAQKYKNNQFGESYRIVFTIVIHKKKSTCLQNCHFQYSRNNVNKYLFYYFI